MWAYGVVLGVILRGFWENVARVKTRRLANSLARASFTDLCGQECPECRSAPWMDDGEPCHVCEGMGRVPAGLYAEATYGKRVNR